MIWTKIIDGTLELVTLFIIWDYSRADANLAINPSISPKSLAPSSHALRWTAPAVTAPIQSPFGSMPTNPEWNPGPDAKATAANISTSAQPDTPALTRCATIVGSA